MTEEDKELLLKNLCARLPYGVICNSNEYRNLLFNSSHIDDIEKHVIKPYLRPISSMSEEEKKELENYLAAETISSRGGLESILRSQRNTSNFLYSKHFDLLGLIEKGLALEAPEGMYNVNK